MCKHGVFLKWEKATMFCPSALTNHSPTIPACIKPQTSVSVKPIQSLSQTAVKTKESAAFSDNLAVFRIRRCARRRTSALFTGAGISTLKSICRGALSSHHAAVIVSSIYSNYSFHHFWFTKKNKKKNTLNTSLEFLQFFPPFGTKKPLNVTLWLWCWIAAFSKVELKCFVRGFSDGFTRFPVDISMGRRWCLWL